MPETRTYNGGTFDRILGMPPKTAQYPWPADCFIQGGENGLVLETGSLADVVGDPQKAAAVVAGALGAPVEARHYRTAFFEAFPRNPDTFIRGEGKTIEEAETDAWAQFCRLRDCREHEFERRQYRTGAGICRKCGMFSSLAFLTTLEPCVVCGRNDNKASFGTDKFNRWHCEACYRRIPEENRSKIHKLSDQMRAERSEGGLDGGT